MKPARKEPVSLLICALGGEGGGVLTDWLMRAARLAGYLAQATSVPGVAQRTGATTYYLELWPELNPLRTPIFGMNPIPGRLDALISSELLETVRQINNGMVNPDRTQLLTSTVRALTTAERTVMGDGRVDSQQLLLIAQQFSQRLHAFDFSQMAKQHQTIVSSVMLGAIAGSGIFPIQREFYERAICGDSHSTLSSTDRASLAGFSAAFDWLQAERNQMQHVLTQVNEALNETPFEQMKALGKARLTQYQGVAYAQLYEQRLQTFAIALAPEGQTELARWLALWMAFDDIAQVAQLKLAQSRVEKIRAEAKAQPQDLVKVFEHFKPGVPELAGFLPAALAKRLIRWDQRRISRGKEPWSFAVKLGSHKISSVILLRCVGAMRNLRSYGGRYREEQRLIEQWLAAIQTGAQRSPALGVELAKCGRLIKGYGSTNERSKFNLIHILEHLAPMPDASEAAKRVAKAREAALQDEAGKAFDLAMLEAGAPKRPVQEQIIRFVRQPKANPHANN